MVVLRRIAQAGADALALALALVLATLLRHDGKLNHVDIPALLLFLPPTLIVQLLVGTHFGLYTGHWRYGCFEEMSALARTVAVTTGLGLMLDTALGRLVPRSAIIVGGLTALVLTAGMRYGVRSLGERRMRPDQAR